MMLKPPMNDLLKQVPSRYMLVNVVAQRARKIASEAEEQGISLEDKPVSMALQEVAEGKCIPQEMEAEAEEITIAE